MCLRKSNLSTVDSMSNSRWVRILFQIAFFPAQEPHCNSHCKISEPPHSSLDQLGFRLKEKEYKIVGTSQPLNNGQ